MDAHTIALIRNIGLFVLGTLLIYAGITNKNWIYINKYGPAIIPAPESPRRTLRRAGAVILGIVLFVLLSLNLLVAG